MIYNEVFKLTTKNQNVWFTSDTHFSHNNIIRYCERPFTNIQEMNEKLIHNWNSVVNENDIVFHLGDFGFDSIENLRNIRNKLNGTIYLIRGNHDWKTINKHNENIFDGVFQQLIIQVDGQKIYLNHYPFLCYSGSTKEGKMSVWQLFGHVHSKKGMNGMDKDRLGVLYPTQYDVGVDNNEYKPISFNEVKQIIYNRKRKSKSIKNRIISKILKFFLTKL